MTRVRPLLAPWPRPLLSPLPLPPCVPFVCQVLKNAAQQQRTPVCADVSASVLQASITHACIPQQVPNAYRSIHTTLAMDLHAIVPVLAALGLSVVAAAP